MAYICYPETQLIDRAANIIETWHASAILRNYYTGSIAAFKSAYNVNDGELFDLTDLFEYPVTEDYHNSKIVTLSNGCNAVMDVTQNTSNYYEAFVSLYDENWTLLDKYQLTSGGYPDYLIWYPVLNTEGNTLTFAYVQHDRGASYLYGDDSGYSYTAGRYAHFIQWLNGAELTEDPYQTGPTSEPEGGYGDFDYSGDSIDLPALPSLSIADSGFVTLYKPTLAQLQSLSQYLWAGLFDPSTFKKIFADPMDCIISLAIAPVSPSATQQQELKVGNVGTGVTIDVLDNQFCQVTYKTLNFGQRTKTFMDDSPYTKAQIYLPYIGVRGLAIDDIIRADLELQYNIDLFTGACNASLKCTKRNKDANKSQLASVLYQFTGNVLANIPVTGQNFAAFIQATIGAVGTAVGVATGAGAVAGLASAVNAATSMKPDVEKSGNLSSTAGFLGVQKPYLILTYPHVCIPSGRDDVVGTPSFIGLSSSRKLSSFKGFTLLHKVNVKGLYCTDTERNMILQALTGEGVIL